jgi:hypothetical protein
MDDFVIAQPIQHANLTIFPVSSLEANLEDRFTTLDEGLREGTVEVFEIGADSDSDDDSNDGMDDPLDDLFGDAPDGEAEVNRVMVINRSSKPLYLMPGEIIMGGDQDRAVAEEFVLQPNDNPVPVDVFCVEHGRWGGRAPAQTEDFIANATAASSGGFALAVAEENQAAAEANRGKFIASVGALNKPARLAVQASKDQDTVWESVANVNTANGIEIETGAFTGNYVSKDSLDQLKPYIDSLQDEVAGVDNIVGVVVAINGKVHTMDLFESTPLFTKLWPKLLKSYALDAASVADTENAKAVCAHEDAREFVDGSMQADVDESETKRGIAITRRSSESVITFSAEDAAMGGGFGGGFGGVHTSAFSK